MRLLKFGTFEVDLDAGELRKSGVRQKLNGQPFQVLQVLLERPQQVVTREELRQRLWPENTFVDYDLALKKAVNRAREALGDSAGSPRFIETIPRRGYRFIAPLMSPVDTPASDKVTAGNKERRTWLRWGALAVSIVAVAALFIGLSSSRLRRRVLGIGAPRIQSLAVIPLTNLSGDAAQEYFSDGMTDALITELAQIGSIRVISRTSSMQYNQTKKSLPEIARELNVDGIVEGTVQRSGDRVRISAQLIHGPTDKHLWANSYERDVRDVFLLEREVAGDIARQVQARITADQRTPPGQPRPISPEALEAYLQGNAHMQRFMRGFGSDELKLASASFQQAIDAEPDFAAAYVGLSRAHRGALKVSAEDVYIARRAVERALELDPNLSGAWTALADIKCDFWDWAGAEKDYRRALAL
ncbi:MAG: winged helix-turn-helix domain-containing protein, partial [Acidobacteriaceae bacterium]|nr:winged helix-turn-helix domain-containing protein [Acidobacteriaceae bacterium]